MKRILVQCDTCKCQEDLVNGDVPREWITVTANKQLRHYCTPVCMKADSVKLTDAVIAEKPTLNEVIQNSWVKLTRGM